MWNPHPKNPDRELGNIPNMLQQVEIVQEKDIEVRENNFSKQLCVYKHSDILSVFFIIIDNYKDLMKLIVIIRIL